MNNKSVIIFEDDHLIKNTLNQFLTYMNIKIITQNEDFTDTNFFFAEAPDLIIADLTSIEKKKVDILIYMKSIPAFFRVPFLSIISSKFTKVKALDIGFNYYLEKPFTENEFTELIKKLFTQYDKISPW